MSLKQDYKKPFHYANEVEFLYDHRDYEYIPGLLRPQNDVFLTPVFFNLAVLNKYSQYPDYRLDLFSKTYGRISNNNDVDIDFGINRDKKVIMWLGDIDTLPKEEQHYLRSENVESDHDLYSEFYEAQIEIQFSNPSPENALFHARSECIKICKQKHNGDLYQLQGEVSKIIENLDRPVFWEERHIKLVIDSLNQIMVESFNVNFLKQQLESVIDKKEFEDIKSKSIKLLEKWLHKILNLSDYSNIALPFFVLKDFRNHAFHVSSDSGKQQDLKSINQRLNLPEENQNYELIYDVLIHKLTESYQIIIKQM